MSFGPDLNVDSCHEEDQLITEILLPPLVAQKRQLLDLFGTYKRLHSVDMVTCPFR